MGPHAQVFVSRIDVFVLNSDKGFGTTIIFFSVTKLRVEEVKIRKPKHKNAPMHQTTDN